MSNILKSVKPADIVSFLLIGFFFLLLVWVGWGGQAGRTVEIRVDKRVYRYPLDEDRVFDWQTDHGKGRVEIKGGKVRMLESSCRDQICVRKGWIFREGDAIICMPNHVVVEILPGREVIDGITE